VNAVKIGSADPVLDNLDRLLPDLEALYTDVHAHPELSMQETRTAGLVADRLRSADYEVTTGVGKTGVVGLLRNGEGPTVMLRADMDALPVEEATGLPYASKVRATDRDGKTVPVMHACGHDMHVAWLVGATTLLAQARRAWRGTLMAVFQPAEETAEGARAMIDDGLFDRFPQPSVVLGQHVMVGPGPNVASGCLARQSRQKTAPLFRPGRLPPSPPPAGRPPSASPATLLAQVRGAWSRRRAQATCMSWPQACITGTVFGANCNRLTTWQMRARLTWPSLWKLLVEIHHAFQAAIAASNQSNLFVARGVYVYTM
jgi:Peptidase family M20/M25/M40